MPGVPQIVPAGDTAIAPIDCGSRDGQIEVNVRPALLARDTPAVAVAT